MSEKTLLNDLQIQFSKVGRRLFRNNVGIGWAGNATRFDRITQVFVAPGDVLIKNARPLHSGLCKGSADLIGFSPMRIKGKLYAIFTALEIKVGRTPTTPEQISFINMVKQNGGIAGIVRTPDEAESVIREFEESVKCK